MRIRASVEASTDAVASSRIKTRGSTASAARNRQALSLPTRERDPAFADDRVVAVGKLLDELVRLCEPCDAFHVCFVEIGSAEHDVLAYGGRE